MSIALESDGKPLSTGTLLLRGVIFIVLVAAVTAVLLAKSEGVFAKSVRVTAVLADVGDGLPPKSDVKYQGVLVGLVNSVAPAGSGVNDVRIDLLPGFAAKIPGTVTARVVPSNVFAVPSVQLVDNGPGPALAAGAQIPEDRSLATVRLQTSLTALDHIVAAVGRSPDDPTVGILALLEQATSGRGAEALAAGRELDQVAQALNQQMVPDGSVPLLGTLTDALDGLQASSPDLLTALHDAVVPLRAVAAEKQQMTDLLTGSIGTTTTLGTALQHNSGTIMGITGKMGPVLDVWSQGGRGFGQMTTSETRLSGKFLSQFWHEDTQSATAKIIVELTPHRQYTRADCPRYYNLAGPSCADAPLGPSAIASAGVGGPAPSPGVNPFGGNVGQAGSTQEQAQIESLFGVGDNSASDLLAGPLVRGNDITVKPAADVTTTQAGGH